MVGCVFKFKNKKLPDPKVILCVLRHILFPLSLKGRLTSNGYVLPRIQRKNHHIFYDNGINQCYDSMTSVMTIGNRLELPYIMLCN
jgi:hypothetical protein